MNPESQQIKQLRHRYKGSLLEKADIVSEHLHSLLDMESPDESKLKTIRDDLHKFAGSSGMYGYDDIAGAAREGMAMIDDMNEVQLHHKLIALRNLLRGHAKS